MSFLYSTKLDLPPLCAILLLFPSLLSLSFPTTQSFSFLSSALPVLRLSSFHTVPSVFLTSAILSLSQFLLSAILPYSSVLSLLCHFPHQPSPSSTLIPGTFHSLSFNSRFSMPLSLTSTVLVTSSPRFFLNPLSP
jgi:hypothetical protein